MSLGVSFELFGVVGIGESCGLEICAVRFVI